MLIDKSMNLVCRIPFTYTDNTGNAANVASATITIYPANSDIPVVNETAMTNFETGFYYYPFDTTLLNPGQFLIKFKTVDTVTQIFTTNLELIDSLRRGTGVNVVNPDGTPSTNLTAINIANLISQKVINMEAQVDGNHPTLSEIYAEMTSEQRILAGMENWTWLNGNLEIKNFEILTTTGDISNGTAREFSNDLSNGNTVGTSYWAERFTTNADTLSRINSSYTYVISDFGGFGVANGLATILICPDLNGRPDINNPLLTSNTVTLAYASGGGDINNFAFTSTENPLLRNTNYWYVFKFVPASDNGSTIAPCGTTSASSTTFKMTDGATTWTAVTSIGMTININYTDADYTTEITLPTNFTEAYAMYVGDNTEKSCNMLPYNGARYINSGLDLPVDTFTVRRVSNGVVLYYHASVMPLTWILEGRLSAGVISQDTDTLLVPDDFVDYIVYRCAGNFINRGIGISTVSGDSYLMQASAMKTNMDFRYLPKPQGGFRVMRSGRTVGSLGNFTDSFRRRTYGR